jgi:predicted nucleic acid-binding protein
VLITAERQGQTARHMLAAISRQTGNTEIVVSVITLIELAHGAAGFFRPRANFWRRLTKPGDP